MLLVSQNVSHQNVSHQNVSHQNVSHPRDKEADRTGGVEANQRSPSTGNTAVSRLRSVSIKQSHFTFLLMRKRHLPSRVNQRHLPSFTSPRHFLRLSQYWLHVALLVALFFLCRFWEMIIRSVTELMGSVHELSRTWSVIAARTCWCEMDIFSFNLPSSGLPHLLSPTISVGRKNKRVFTFCRHLVQLFQTASEATSLEVSKRPNPKFVCVSVCTCVCVGLSVFYLLLDHWRDRNETFRDRRHQPLDDYYILKHCYHFKVTCEKPVPRLILVAHIHT